jgi:hypothetical protein
MTAAKNGLSGNIGAIDQGEAKAPMTNMNAGSVVQLADVGAR